MFLRGRRNKTKNNISIKKLAQGFAVIDVFNCPGKQACNRNDFYFGMIKYIFSFNGICNNEFFNMTVFKHFQARIA